MLINNKTTTDTSPDPNKLFADGMVYINTSQWILAYPVFAHLCRNTKNKSVSLLYNMALCHIFSKEYSKAIAVLEEALACIAVPSVSFHSASYLPGELSAHEYNSNSYHLALSETAVVLNTAIVKLRIRRLMVNIHLELQNWQEVIRLSSLPEMDKCKNIIEALTIAKTKTNTLNK